MFSAVAGRKPKTHPLSMSNGSAVLGIKKRTREGKGNMQYYGRQKISENKVLLLTLSLYIWNYLRE